MRILGIDPGLNRTGYAVIEGDARSAKLLEGGVLRSNASNSLSQRVLELRNGLLEVIRDHAPDVVGIEQVFSLPKNPKTAVLMAHARGALLVTLAEAELAIAHFTPNEIKKHITGSGHASKGQIQRSVQILLGLDSVLEPNDVADAAAVAICRLNAYLADAA